MRRLLFVLLLSAACSPPGPGHAYKRQAAPEGSAIPNWNSGPNCTTGCRCGNACISCAKRCRK